MSLTLADRATQVRTAAGLRDLAVGAVRGATRGSVVGTQSQNATTVREARGTAARSGDSLT